MVQTCHDSGVDENPDVTGQCINNNAFFSTWQSGQQCGFNVTTLSIVTLAIIGGVIILSITSCICCCCYCCCIRPNRLGRRIRDLERAQRLKYGTTERTIHVPAHQGHADNINTTSSTIFQPHPNPVGPFRPLAQTGNVQNSACPNPNLYPIVSPEGGERSPLVVVGSPHR
eukprot:TRINITY_DN5030_c0_g1_i2.p2 TRINITY_DN5030_c0_g1~~TRINITY_DN5030_c0_g1_i2.p2  ORF type:complete len:171 (-),score=38.85 TRINITY_DN5030_c0_g1_i2:252-764(-)